MKIFQIRKSLRRFSKPHLRNLIWWSQPLRSLGLKHNLLSVGQLAQRGYNVVFKGDDCFIYDKPPKKMLFANVKMEKNYDVSSFHEV